MVCPTVLPAGTCGATTGCLSPLPRSRIGWRRGEKKAQARMDTDFLDWALADFSGYVALDELYDGPFCILSAVDNRCYKRLLYDVLDHDPTHDDIRAFLGRLKTVLVARALTLLGISRRMAQPSILRPWRRLLAEYGINSVSFILWLTWSKRCWVWWPARRRVSLPSNLNCPKGVRARQR